MASDLTAADLARLEGDIPWVARSVPTRYPEAVAACCEAVPALVATVRALAREITRAPALTHYCPWCGLSGDWDDRDYHPDHCAVRRARALLGEEAS